MSYEEVLESPHETESRGTLELPESVELLERPESAQEAQEMGETSPYRYSEAYLDAEGMYHPRQITGIYKDGLEGAGCREVAESLKEWQMQEKRLSCAVQCVRMIVNKLLGTELTEAQLREEGQRKDLYQDGRGTYKSDVGALAEGYGLERQQYTDLTTQDLIEAKRQGANLIVAVDSMLLAYPTLPKMCTTDHAVEVIGFDLADKKNPMVILNDPGRPEGCGSAYPLEVFEKAAHTYNKEAGGMTYDLVTALYREKGE